MKSVAKPTLLRHDTMTPQGIYLAQRKVYTLVLQCQPILILASHKSGMTRVNTGFPASIKRRRRGGGGSGHALRGRAAGAGGPPVSAGRRPHPRHGGCDPGKTRHISVKLTNSHSTTEPT